MKAQVGEFSYRLLCRVLDLPRSSLYYQPLQPSDPALRSALEAEALEYPHYGYRRTITIRPQAQHEALRWTVLSRHGTGHS